MCKSLNIYLLIFFSASLLLACGESDAPQEKSAAQAPATEAVAVQHPAEIPDMSLAEAPVVNAVQEESMEIEYLPSQVVYQEEIYKDWPYTDAPVMNETIADVSQMVDQAIAPVTEQAQTTLDEILSALDKQVPVVVVPPPDTDAPVINVTIADVSQMVDQAIAPVTEQAQSTRDEILSALDKQVPVVVVPPPVKPYQLVDGKISANVIEGWKTYNGGGCGVCHGKGGIGAVGPFLGNSVTTKLSKDDFVNIVTNGKSGTLMRGSKTNKRVMDNIDNLYAYLVARGDGVLGPENLIKFPLGKNE